MTKTVPCWTRRRRSASPPRSAPATEVLEHAPVPLKATDTVETLANALAARRGGVLAAARAAADRGVTGGKSSARCGRRTRLAPPPRGAAAPPRSTSSLFKGHGRMNDTTNNSSYKVYSDTFVPKVVYFVVSRASMYARVLRRRSFFFASQPASRRERGWRAPRSARRGVGGRSARRQHIRERGARSSPESTPAPRHTASWSLEARRAPGRRRTSVISPRGVRCVNASAASARVPRQNSSCTCSVCTVPTRRRAEACRTKNTSRQPFGGSRRKRAEKERIVESRGGARRDVARRAKAHTLKW